MSHISVYEVEITRVNLNLLKKVFRFMATKHNGLISKEIKGFFKKDNRTCDLALFTPEMKRGLGAIITTEGKLEFVVDPYGVEETVEKIKCEILQTYQALAVRSVLKKMGYKINVHDLADGIKIEAQKAVV